MRTCYFCGRWGRSKQSIRAHLRHCVAYRLHRDGELTIRVTPSDEELEDLIDERLEARERAKAKASKHDLYECPFCRSRLVADVLLVLCPHCQQARPHQIGETNVPLGVYPADTQQPEPLAS